MSEIADKQQTWITRITTKRQKTIQLENCYLTMEYKQRNYLFIYIKLTIMIIKRLCIIFIVLM